MTSKKWVGLLGLALGTLAVPLTTRDARAGLKFTQPVYVDTFNKYADGGVGYTRNTSTSNDYIGCTVTQYTTSIAIECEATDALGNFQYCFTNNAQYVNAVNSIGMDSEIAFQADSSGSCSYIYVANFSWSAPKQP